MLAKELFKNLGYELIRNDDDYVIYSKSVSSDGVTKEVSFSDQTESVQVYFEDNFNSHQTPSMDVSLIGAINQQIKELNW